jgi:hypothetical protein
MREKPKPPRQKQRKLMKRLLNHARKLKVLEILMLR